MVLVIDIGNTNIKCGLYSDGKLANSWRMSTVLEKTADEYGIKLMAFFQQTHRDPDDIRGIIISSVIPSINYTMEHMCRIYFQRKPIFVGPGIRTGIDIKYDNPKELGADRIVNAVAGYDRYGGPLIIVDFGTATSFGVVSEKGEFLGGAISPGIKISAEALTVSAAKLPRVELMRPESLIQRNTISAMQAGIIHGYVGHVDYIIRRLKQEMDCSPKVIATGGMAGLIAAETDEIDEIDSLLTLNGLYLLYQKNAR